jgi:ATP-dependent DNA ligase
MAFCGRVRTRPARRFFSQSHAPSIYASKESMPPRSRVASPKRASDPFPDTLSPQLATLVSKPPDRGDWVYEIKLDGYRLLARCEGGQARLFTRNRNDWTAKMASLAREVATLPIETAWLDGEVVVLGEGGIPDFNALQNAFDKRGTEAITYFIFDVLYLNGRISAALSSASGASCLKRSSPGTIRGACAWRKPSPRMDQASCNPLARWDSRA